MSKGFKLRAYNIYISINSFTLLAFFGYYNVFSILAGNTAREVFNTDSDVIQLVAGAASAGVLLSKIFRDVML